MQFTSSVRVTRSRARQERAEKFYYSTYFVTINTNRGFGNLEGRARGVQEARLGRWLYRQDASGLGAAGFVNSFFRNRISDLFRETVTRGGSVEPNIRDLNLIRRFRHVPIVSTHLDGAVEVGNQAGRVHFHGLLTIKHRGGLPDERVVEGYSNRRAGGQMAGGRVYMTEVQEAIKEHLSTYQPNEFGLKNLFISMRYVPSMQVVFDYIQKQQGAVNQAGISQLISRIRGQQIAAQAGVSVTEETPMGILSHREQNRLLEEVDRLGGGGGAAAAARREEAESEESEESEESIEAEEVFGEQEEEVEAESLSSESSEEEAAPIVRSDWRRWQDTSGRVLPNHPTPLRTHVERLQRANEQRRQRFENYLTTKVKLRPRRRR